MDTPHTSLNTASIASLSNSIIPVVPGRQAIPAHKLTPLPQSTTLTALYFRASIEQVLQLAQSLHTTHTHTN